MKLDDKSYTLLFAAAALIVAVLWMSEAPIAEVVETVVEES